MEGSGREGKGKDRERRGGREGNGGVGKELNYWEARVEQGGAGVGRDG